MPLATQVAGALLAGGIVFLLVRSAGLSRSQAVGAIAVVPIVVACLMTVQWSRIAVVVLDKRHDASVGTDAAEARIAGGLSIGMNVEFLSWVERRLGPGDTFHLLTDNDPNRLTIEQWVLFQLAPHVALHEPEPADWLILYEKSPRSDYPRHLFERPSAYAKGFALARRRR